MANLNIATGEWHGDADGFLLNCRVNFGKLKLYAFAILVESYEDEGRTRQRELDPNSTQLEKLVELCDDSTPFATVKIPDWEGDYVVWVEPA